MDHGAFTRVVHEDTQVQVILPFKYNFFNWFLLAYLNAIIKYNKCYNIFVGSKADANDGKCKTTHHSYHYSSILWKTCCGFINWEQGNLCSLHHCW